jgi:hypothetical protein
MAPLTDNSKRTGAAIEAHYRFLAWLVPTIEKFPKSHKFHLERMAAIEEEQAPDENDDSDFLRESAEQLAAKRARIAQLNELLTSIVLGTG